MLPAGLHIVDGKVLQGGRDLEVINVITLQAPHIGDTHATCQKRVLAKNLLDASPPWVTAYIDNRRAKYQTMLATRPIGVGVVKRATLIRHCRCNRLDEIRIPRCSHGDRDWKQGCWLLGPD